MTMFWFWWLHSMLTDQVWVTGPDAVRLESTTSFCTWFFISAISTKCSWAIQSDKDRVTGHGMGCSRTVHRRTNQVCAEKV